MRSVSGVSRALVLVVGVTSVCVVSAQNGLALPAGSAPAPSAGYAGSELPDSLRELNECGDPAFVARRVEDFHARLEQVLLGLGGLSAAQSQIGLESVAQLRRQDPARQQQMCQYLLANPALESRLSTAVVAVDQRAQASCMSDETYISLASLVAAIKVYGTVFAGICGAAACPALPFEPPTCPFLCVVPRTVVQVTFPIDTSLQVDDKCSGSQHLTEMAAMRTQVTQKLTGLTQSLSVESIPVLTAIAAISVTESDLDGFIDELRRLLGAPSGSANGQPSKGASGISDVLEQLVAALNEQRAVQQASERARIGELIEAGFAQSTPTSILVLPGSVGGLLEQVRELVAQRIGNAGAAGLPTVIATNRFREGDTAFNNQDYRLAYQRYQAAYAALVEPSRQERAQ